MAGPAGHPPAGGRLLGRLLGRFADAGRRRERSRGRRRGGPVRGVRIVPATAPASAGASGAAGGSAGTSTGARAIARSVPTRLLIPDIGVDTPVMSLGLAADGTVQVPPIKQASPAGWYQGSPTPGQTGPSVLLGHVTVGQYGDGVFKKLDQLRPGARVLVRLADGATAEFVVDRVRTVAKDNFPSDEVYGNVDRPELRLITCGGAHTADGYTDNVVVFASLSGSAG
ncbi:class F sortase [Catenulispora yoronensis]